MTKQDDDQDKIRVWLRSVLAKTGWTMGRVSRESGVSPSTLSRINSDDPNYKFTATTKTIGKIARATGVSPPNTEMNFDGKGFAEPDVIPFIGLGKNQHLSSNNNLSQWVVQNRAMELDGYLPGDILTVDMSVAPKRGDIVCAQIYDNHGGADTILRRYLPNFIVTSSLDKRFRDLSPQFVDNEKVLIMGTVVEMVRRAKSEAKQAA